MDKPDWAVGQTVRETGLLEDLCEHGVGHPNKQWLAERKITHPWQAYWGTHGCDGCCSK